MGLFTLNPDGDISGVIEAIDPVSSPYPRVEYTEFETPIKVGPLQEVRDHNHERGEIKESN